MAAINGANLGLGLVTMGLETDFPEAARNTNPGTANVRSNVTYKIENVTYTGLGEVGTEPDTDAAMLIETTVTGVRRNGPVV